MKNFSEKSGPIARLGTELNEGVIFPS